MIIRSRQARGAAFSNNSTWEQVNTWDVGGYLDPNRMSFTWCKEGTPLPYPQHPSGLIKVPASLSTNAN